MNELLPCPFCGGEPVFKPATSYGKGEYGTVGCNTFKCRGRGPGGKLLKAEAIKVWNTRA